MKRAQDGIESGVLDSQSLDAANDPVIDGVHLPAEGKDPID
jgi:hypothetical protein